VRNATALFAGGAFLLLLLEHHSSARIGPNVAALVRLGIEEPAAQRSGALKAAAFGLLRLTAAERATRMLGFVRHGGYE
jgi:hypothetical protein